MEKNDHEQDNDDKDTKKTQECGGNYLDSLVDISLECLPMITADTSNYSDSSEHTDDKNGEKEKLTNDWGDDFEDDHVSCSHKRLVALYSYDGAEEGTLSTEIGEEFEVVGENVDGWIKVLRISQCKEEGFIPTAFTQIS
eukprot:GFUD01119832.1.p1 GENE.GFUD01119832.1~~GFUD01119832.1.p1  ORF type:complete len:161 (+),score=40.63 GFUD01119832.1:65-484(+)